MVEIMRNREVATDEGALYKGFTEEHLICWHHSSEKIRALTEDAYEAVNSSLDFGTAERIHKALDRMKQAGLEEITRLIRRKQTAESWKNNSAKLEKNLAVSERKKLEEVREKLKKGLGCDNESLREIFNENLESTKLTSAARNSSPHFDF